jgi:penicillin-binding protein 1B
VTDTPRTTAKTPRRWRRWLKWGGLTLLLVVLALGGTFAYFYAKFARVVDQRLYGEPERSAPRVFARPLELRRGLDLGTQPLADRLNLLGYARRPRAEAAGQFAVAGDALDVVPREGTHRGEALRIELAPAGPRESGRRRIAQIRRAGGEPVDAVTLDAPMLTALATGSREKRRKVPLEDIPLQVRQAVLAIEDRRFYDHPGVDVLRTASAVLTNLRGDRPYLVGGSTLTQQLVKNSFLTPEKTIRRKLLEQLMAIVLERRLGKEEILALYLNEVYLGQRGSFAIHGVAEAARAFFGKDVANLDLGEAATIAGVIQSPPAYSPVRAPARARERRNVVLHAMAEVGYITDVEARRTAEEPLGAVTGTIDAQAPYFVDVVGQQFAEQFPGLTDGRRPVDIHTSIDVNLQRIAHEELRDGLARTDEYLAKRGRPAVAQGGIIVVDTATGEVLALVGGRSYGGSQFNRVASARRQPGSVFKPFVYLAAFELAAQEGRTDLTPATVVVDEPTTFPTAEGGWTPGNFNDEYDGPITLRRALTMSRNVATAKVAEAVGFGRVAALWRRIGVGQQARGYPSIALGVFEATPWEIAEAYTVFPNLGQVRRLHTITRLASAGDVIPLPQVAPIRIARDDTTFLVTDMMRSVVDEGTGNAARRAGLTHDAAGKTGTTNDLRDAWFAGFTPDLLAVVWVGLDDNQVIGLSGSQAALPIWAGFMTRALAGRPNVPFRTPLGITAVEIDRDTGMLPSPGCPRLRMQAFLPGTEPTMMCDQHGF